MFAQIRTTRRNLGQYAALVGEQQIEEIRSLAAPFAGARVLHLTTTPFGTGAPEELAALVPLLNDLAVDAEWQAVRGDADFARVNRAIADAVGGLRVRFKPEMIDTWLRYNAMNALLMDQEYDFVIVHDPYVVAIPRLREEREHKKPGGQWIWHCHLDLSQCRGGVWALLRPYISSHFQAAMFTAEGCLKEDLHVPIKIVVPPAIDPLSVRNMEVAPPMQRHIVESHGIDAERPIVTSIARFVRWSDPLGVVQACCEAKKRVGNLQLVLVWAMPDQRESNRRRYEQAIERVRKEEGVHVLTNLNEVGNLEQNALQRAARVVVQKSLRRGFATTVAESSWKQKPVVVDRVGVIPGQVVDGQTGFVVDDIDEMAERIVKLVEDPRLAGEMGTAGHEYTRQNFLITRALRDYLGLFRTLSQEKARAAGG